MTVGQADDFGGSLTVRLGVEGARIATVDIVSTRPANASRVFIGRSPAEVSVMMGRIFSLCACAQTVAGLEALEQAQGLVLAPAHGAARNLLRLAEMLSQTALRLSLDWPRLLGLALEPDIARACLRAEQTLEQALFAGAVWKSPGSVSFSPDLAAIGEHIESLKHLVDMAVAQNGLADRLRQAVADQGLDDFGRLMNGAVALREDGAVNRRWGDVRVKSVRDAHGLGLATRLEARVADLSALPYEMLEVAKVLGPGEAYNSEVMADGVGAAEVQTARGALSHTVTLKGGLVASYGIDAPTDANFAPDGPVAAGLLGADAIDMDDLMRAAELHVMAIDPCVECKVEVDHA
jgi:coenzyme F420-reducing hydrogenase alpha subunit